MSMAYVRHLEMHALPVQLADQVNVALSSMKSSGMRHITSAAPNWEISSTACLVPAQLDLTTQDRFEHPVKTKEWFWVLLHE